MLATKHGLVKKTKLTDFDSNRTGGIVAINLREDDELIDAALISAERRSAAGQPQGDVDPVHAPTTRRCGRWAGPRPVCSACGSPATTSCWRWRSSRDDSNLEILVATEGGYAKRTRIDEYPVQGRGGKGVLTARIVSTRGGLVGAVAVRPEDEIYAITSDGVVIRTQGRGGPPGTAADHGRAPDEPARRRERGRHRPQRRRTGRAGVSMTQSPHGQSGSANTESPPDDDRQRTGPAHAARPAR